ncbi:MAG: HNH endonuclease [Candidatus Magasanikiibacteriota bacterium]
MGSVAGNITSAGYRNIKVFGRQYKAHRLAFLYMEGKFPLEDVDHRDGNPDKNMWANLRACSTAQNVCNTRIRKDNTSGVKGVYFRKDLEKWGAKVCVNAKQIHLGFYDKLELANLVATEARELHHGAYARHI